MLEKKEPPYLILFILLSLLLHLSLAYHYREWQPSTKALKELHQKRKAEIPVQIIELPPKEKKKEVPKPPPQKPRFLADRNQQSKTETRTDESAPKTAAPRLKPKPQAKPKSRPSKDKAAIIKPRPQTKTPEKDSPPVKKKAVKKLTKEPVKESLPDIKKLFPSFEELTKITEERRNRPVPSGKHHPRLPNKLKSSTEISLNTLDYKFHSYYLALKRKIELVWEYPYQARRTGAQGRLLIRFVINQDGSLAEVTILRSSGVALLDHEAVRAIRDASPFPPLPERMNTKHLTVTATFEYLLTYRSVH